MCVSADVAALRCRRAMKAAARLRRRCFRPGHRLYNELQAIERRFRELFQVAVYETSEEVTEEQYADMIRLIRQLRLIREQVEGGQREV